MAELDFEVVQEADGGYCAECLTENIFTGSLQRIVRQAPRRGAIENLPASILAQCGDCCQPRFPVVVTEECLRKERINV